MALCWEITKSPVYGSDNSVDRTFVVTEVTDDTQAIGLAAAFAGIDYIGRIRDEVPASVRPIGYSIWEIVWHYQPPPDNQQQPPPDPPDLAAIIEFDTTGGTAHVTQCKEETDFGAISGTDIKDAKMIGVSGDSVEGTDIVVPKLAFTVTRRPPVITGNYILNLARMTGKTNKTNYTIRGKVLGTYVEIDFDDGELLFVGVSPSGSDSFAYKFEASENVAVIDLGQGIDGPVKVKNKKGHDYVWTMFDKKELTNPQVAVPVPKLAFVARMYDAEDYKSKLGF